MGIYLLWAIMTILSTRVYLNLVFQVRKPTIEQTEEPNVRFAGSPRREEIKMHVHTTTFDNNTTIGSGGYGYGRRGGGMTLDSVSICSPFCPDVALTVN
jgi:hypothetical protein